MFGELDVDGFFGEFDDERSGGFAPLRFVPPGKQVVLGLVTTKTGSSRTQTTSSGASMRPRGTCLSTSYSPSSAASSGKEATEKSASGFRSGGGAESGPFSSGRWT